MLAGDGDAAARSVALERAAHRWELWFVEFWFVELAQFEQFVEQRLVVQRFVEHAEPVIYVDELVEQRLVEQRMVANFDVHFVERHTANGVERRALEVLDVERFVSAFDRRRPLADL